MPFFDKTHLEKGNPEAQYNGPQLTFADWFPGVFIKPSYIFEIIRNRGPRTSDWFVPLLLVSFAYGLAFSAAFWNESYVEDYTAAIRALPISLSASADKTQAEVDRDFESTVSWMKYTGPVLWFLSLVVLTYLSTVITWILVLLISLTRQRFKLLLALNGPISVASFPGALIAQLVMAIFGIFPFGFNAAQVAGVNMADPLYGWLMFIDPFIIYGCAVGYIGLTVAVGLTKWKALAIISLSAVLEILFISHTLH